MSPVFDSGCAPPRETTSATPAGQGKHLCSETDITLTPSFGDPQITFLIGKKRSRVLPYFIKKRYIYRPMHPPVIGRAAVKVIAMHTHFC